MRPARKQSAARGRAGLTGSGRQHRHRHDAADLVSLSENRCPAVVDQRSMHSDLREGLDVMIEVRRGARRRLMMVLMLFGAMNATVCRGLGCTGIDDSALRQRHRRDSRTSLICTVDQANAAVVEGQRPSPRPEAEIVLPWTNCRRGSGTSSASGPGGSVDPRRGPGQGDDADDVARAARRTCAICALNRGWSRKAGPRRMNCFDHLPIRRSTEGRMRHVVRGPDGTLSLRRTVELPIRPTD